MTDYKRKYTELAIEHMKLKRDLEQSERDKFWLKSVLAFALEHRPALVVREEELKHAPEIELAENLANEIIIRIKMEDR